MTKYLQPREFGVFKIHQGHQIFILPCPPHFMAWSN